MAQLFKMTFGLGKALLKKKQLALTMDVSDHLPSLFADRPGMTP